MYEGFIFKANGIEVGYAIVFVNRERLSCILDYFAIYKEYRNNGYGSIVLDLIKDLYSGYENIIIECESIEEDSDSSLICDRRIKFYERNGFVRTGIDIRTCTGSWSILALHTNNVVNTLISVYKLASDDIAYQQGIKQLMKYVD